MVLGSASAYRARVCVMSPYIQVHWTLITIMTPLCESRSSTYSSISVYYTGSVEEP